MISRSSLMQCHSIAAPASAGGRERAYDSRRDPGTNARLSDPARADRAAAHGPSQRRVGDRRRGWQAKHADDPEQFVDDAGRGRRAGRQEHAVVPALCGRRSRFHARAGGASAGGGMPCPVRDRGFSGLGCSKPAGPRRLGLALASTPHIGGHQLPRRQAGHLGRSHVAFERAGSDPAEGSCIRPTRPARRGIDAQSHRTTARAT